MREYRAKTIIKDCYIRLRSHAKERNIYCDISYEDFKALCLRTNYHLLKGLGPDDLTLDREKEDRSIGYTVGNIRILKNKDNVAKENMRRAGIDWDTVQLWKPVGNVESF